MYCQICEVTFFNKQSLKRHFERIHNKIIVICKICHEVFYSKRKQALHRIKFHELVYECDYCERTFGAKKSLYRHLRRGHGISETRNVNLPNIKRTSPISNFLANPSSSQEKACISSSGFGKKSSRKKFSPNLKGTIHWYIFLKL